jgi:hypothetical protein
MKVIHMPESGRIVIAARVSVGLIVSIIMMMPRT